ncbi:hypothetical protein Salat_2711500 [Sesamum alatum]|uniref:Uncharacterized protein n=1 Tax=Sesamum alatum TaxID=300844 RepID=A0AAE1XR59_9LAMI|nr:hypothetical protein Salat_2711500 [Sesamum alatum]
MSRPGRRVFNMVRAVNRFDVESLSSRSMMGLGHFFLDQNSTTLATITAMLEKMRGRARSWRLLASTPRVSHGSVFYMDEFSTCLEQFKNLGNLPPRFDFSFLNIRVDGFGRTSGDRPSGG